MRRALAVLAVVALTFTGCAGNDDSPTAEDAAATSPSAGSPSAGSPSAGSPSAEDTSPTPDDATDDDADDTGDDSGDDSGDAIEIEIEGDRIQPNGLRVKVAAGETITFDVESDRAAELHVHSSPEQVLEVQKGESTLTLVIDRPGLVDMEEHETGMVLVQLEVR